MSYAFHMKLDEIEDISLLVKAQSQLEWSVKAGKEVRFAVYCALFKAVQLLSSTSLWW